MLAAFVGLITLTFGLVVFVVMDVTSSYLVDQRIREELSVVDELALEAASGVKAADAQGLYELMVERGRTQDARFLLLSPQGTVWVDSLSALNGVRLAHGEVTDITSGALDRSFGLHSVKSSKDAALGGGETWVGYFTANIAYEAESIGVMMMSVSLQDLFNRLNQIQSSLMIYFVLVILIVTAAALYFSNIITRPINELNQLMQQTARRGFSVKANPHGNDEIAQLGRTFNLMSDKLENMDKMRNEFISNASHELKTPLSAMKILIESLLHQEQLDPAMTRDFLSDINQEIDRLSSLVGDLLTLVRFDGQAMTLQKEPIAMEELLFDTVNRLEPIAKANDIKVQVDCDEVCFVAGDPLKLQQVIYNLVDNAIKYTLPGGHVQVELGNVAGRVRMRVSDDGMGIPKESLSHIFDRFYRVDKARSRATGGTGLGLSIVENIVRLHDGDIEVESQEDVGTSFTVWLPAIEDPYADFEQEETEEPHEK